MGSLSIYQLQDMIANTIRAQYGGTSQDTMLYSKPYTRMINGLQMQTGYQPPKFMQFDKNGNPKQHIAHFVETCNNARTEGDHLVKQFVYPWKGNIWLVHEPRARVHQQLGSDEMGILKPFQHYSLHRQHDGAHKFEAVKWRAGCRVHQSMALTESWLQSQAFRNLCNRNMRTRHALETTLHPPKH